MTFAAIVIITLLAGIAVAKGVVILWLHRRLSKLTLERQRTEANAAQRTADASAALGRAESEVRFRTRLLNAVGQAMIAADMDGRVVYYNRAAARLFDRDLHDAIGAKLTDVVADSDPRAADRLLKRLRAGRGWTGEINALRSDGSLAPIMVTDSPIHDEAGRTLGMVRIATDLTSQKRSETASRMLANASAALAATLDYAATVRAVARLALPDLAEACTVDVTGEDGRMWRIDAASVTHDREELAREVRRRYPLTLDAHHPISDVIRSSQARLIPEIRETLLQSIARDAEHLSMLHALGYCSAMIVPLVAGGKTFGALSFFSVSPNRRYEARDLALAEELARRAAIALEHARLYETALLANQSKSDFLAVMSHELRTPLTTIMGYADLLLSGLPEPLAPKAKLYVERVRNAAWHLLGLIEQILVYARLEVGREQLHPERISIAELLAEAAALIEPVAAERGLHFIIEQVKVPQTIETDPTKLRQILLNLLSNAVKFTSEGDVKLGAHMEGSTVVIAVRDTGIGIDPENLEKVFDPFWQVDQSATRAVGGTGLGLSVSRRLARLLGGDITAASAPGQGAVFSVKLPARWTPEEAVRGLPRAATADVVSR